MRVSRCAAAIAFAIVALSGCDPSDAGVAG